MSALGALQATLAAEHAATYVLATLGGATSSSAQPRLAADLADAWAVHRDRRDAMVTAVERAGADPAPAAPAYDLPPDLGRPSGVRAAALEVERRCAATYAALVAESTGGRRAWAVAALSDAAVRELSFAGAPEAFPGLDELADR
jgi:hypothetical protein